LYAEWHMPSTYRKWARCALREQNVEAAIASDSAGFLASPRVFAPSNATDDPDLKEITTRTTRTRP
jgi:hypothetical protein